MADLIAHLHATEAYTIKNRLSRLAERAEQALTPPRLRDEIRADVLADLLLGRGRDQGGTTSASDEARGPVQAVVLVLLNASDLATLMERSSRSTLLVHMPRLEGWGKTPVVKNGAALGGYGAVAMNTALASSITALPIQLRKTLTWDRGKELSGNAQFTLDTGTKVFFADPHSPWQRPTNENTNGLLRQYFPKGTDLSRWSAEDLEAVALALNSRPRKVLGWRAPAEVFAEQLQSLQ